MSNDPKKGTTPDKPPKTSDLLSRTMRAMTPKGNPALRRILDKISQVARRLPSILKRDAD